MAYHLDDTIVAVASPPGGAARAIVRISGPLAAECAGRLFRADSTTGSRPLGSVDHPVVLAGMVSLPGVHSPLPADLYLWPDARSYTGQPVAEFHTIGSPPLVDAVVRAACEAGARLAQPGEFTLRAFLAGRIDLTQAEAVLGVIDATDFRRLDVALEQLAGGLSRPLVRLRSALLDVLCHVEAGFEFPEENLSLVTSPELASRLNEARCEAEGLAAQLRSRAGPGERIRVVLVGRPNAGKSTLFNALAGAERAIVSHHPGTTRDYVSAVIHIEGIDVELIDTAGVGGPMEGRETCNELSADADAGETIHQAAEDVARRECERADVRVHCIDVRLAGDVVREGSMVGELAGLDALDPSRSHSLDSRSDRGRRSAEGPILVWTKVDLIESSDSGPLPDLCVSGVTGRGLDALRTRLAAAVRLARSTPDCAVASTAARCGQSLREAVGAIERAMLLVDEGAGEELLAAEIRAALDAVGRVAGTVYTDDVLDAVFSRFCIGK